MATLIAYLLARRLYLRFGQPPLLQPVFLGGALLIGLLTLAKLNFEDYRPTKDLLV